MGSRARLLVPPGSVVFCFQCQQGRGHTCSTWLPARRSRTRLPAKRLDQLLEIGSGAERTEFRIALHPVGLPPSSVNGLQKNRHRLVGVILGIVVRILVRAGPVATDEFAVEGESAGQVISEKAVLAGDPLAEDDGLMERVEGIGSLPLLRAVTCRSRDESRPGS